MKTKLLMAAVLLISTYAFAQSLGDKKTMKEQEEYLQKEYGEHVKEACGVVISTGFDWKTYNLEWWAEQNSSIYGYCGAAPGGVSQLCQDADAKPLVLKKIKKIVCKSCPKSKEPAGNKGRKLSLKSGTLEYTTCPGESNADDFLKEFLMKNL